MGDDDTSDLSQAAEVAQAAMPLVRSKTIRDSDVAEGALVLGDGIASRSLRTDRLRSFTATEDVRQLLSAPDAITYPVARADEIVSSITVAKDPARGWRFASAGNVNRARSVVRLRDRDAFANGRDPHDYYVVTVPVLGTTLLARDTAAAELEVVFVPGSAADVETGRWMPAKEAFAELAEALRRRRDRADGPPAPG